MWGPPPQKATEKNAQGFLLGLCSGIIPNSLGGPNRVLGVEPGWLHAKPISAFLDVLSLRTHAIVISQDDNDVVLRT